MSEPPDPEETECGEDFRHRLQALRGAKKSPVHPPPFFSSAPITEKTSQTAKINLSNQTQRKKLRQEQREAIKREMLKRFSEYGPPPLSDDEFTDASSSEPSARPDETLSLADELSVPATREDPVLRPTPSPGKSESPSVQPFTYSNLQGIHSNKLSTQAASRLANNGSAVLGSLGYPTPVPAETENKGPARKAPELTSLQQHTLEAAQMLIQPGKLCKAIVLKPASPARGASSWELCFRTYDTLSQPLAFGEELRFLHTPSLLIYNTFATQEMLADLVVGELAIRTYALSDGLSYQLVEVTTARSGHTILLYPLPELSAPLLVTIQFEEFRSSPQTFVQSGHSTRKILCLMEQPLAIGRPILSHATSEAIDLNQPVRYFEPDFDIEKRLRRGQTSNRRDSYRIYFEDDPESWSRARLEPVNQTKIRSQLDRLRQRLPAAHALQPLLATMRPHFISAWSASPNQRWFFSGVFESPASEGRRQIVGLLDWLEGAHRWVLPYLFEASRDRPEVWSTSLSPLFFEGLNSSQHRQLSARFDLDRYSLFEPASQIQHILGVQPISLAQVQLEDFFPSQTAEADGRWRPLPFIFKKLRQTPFADPAWQAFAVQTQVLTQVFQTLKFLSLTDDSNPQIEQQMAELLQNTTLALPLRRQLRQRFQEYRDHSRQSFKYSDQEYYIFEFWQTFFMALFQSLPVPESMQNLTRQGQPFQITELRSRRQLETHICRSNGQDTLVWLISRDKETNLITLLDIVREEENLGLPLQQRAFTFTSLLPLLPADVLALMAPHWRYFGPLSHI